MSHYVYKHFDKAGKLLYVGLTNDLIERHKQHRANSPWWQAIRRFSSSEYENRIDAENSEIEQIHNGQPEFNTCHKDLQIRVVCPKKLTMKRNIKRAMNKSGKTHAVIARELGISRTAVGYWQSATNDALPIVSRIPDFCRVCGVSPSELFEGLDYTSSAS